MRYPFDRYKLGTRYGQRGKSWQCGYHSGLDILSSPYGGDGIVHPIYAGVVQKTVRSDASYGNYVKIKHPDGYISLYAHLKTICVKKGMTVSEQTELGIEGMTGNATGRHLHLEIHKGVYHYPAAINPLRFIEGGMETKKKIKLKLNGKVKTVTAIESDGNNYVRLQDLRDGKIDIGYDAAIKLPMVTAK